MRVWSSLLSLDTLTRPKPLPTYPRVGDKARDQLQNAFGLSTYCGVTCLNPSEAVLLINYYLTS